MYSEDSKNLDQPTVCRLAETYTPPKSETNDRIMDPVTRGLGQRRWSHFTVRRFPAAFSYAPHLGILG